jgi:glycosyltransferase involved in cell wall biosynthesis
LPIYNEELSVACVVKSIHEQMCAHTGEYEVLIVDDGSTDKTREITEQLEGVRVVRHEWNLGYGAAIKTGFAEARGDKVLLMDGDSSYPEEQIIQMLVLSKTCDMVVGERKNILIPHHLVRGILRYLFKLVASILMWTWIPDLNSGMRIIDTQLGRRYASYLPNGFSASSTLTAIFIKKGHSICYKPIPYRTRIGISKLNILLDAMRFFWFLLTKWPKINSE